MNLQTQDCYTPVDVNKRLPIQCKRVIWVMGTDLAAKGYLDEDCGNWWVYLEGEDGEDETFSPYDFTHWLEKRSCITLKVEEFKKTVGDAFDAGEHFGKCDLIKSNQLTQFKLIHENPLDKDTYINQLITP